MTDKTELPSDDAVRFIRTHIGLDIERSGIALTRETIHAYLTATDEGRALVADAGRAVKGDSIALAVQAHFYYGGADTLQRLQRALADWEAAIARQEGDK